MRWPLVLGLLATSATGAAADDGGPVPQAVSGRLDGRTAALTARYLLRFEGPETETMFTTLELPAGAAVTHATVRAGGVAHRLALTPNERARARFDAVVGRAAGPARRWALLLEDLHGMLEVSLLAPRAGAVTLDVELAVPTCFHDDVRYVEVPDTWKPALAPGLRPRGVRTAEVAAACTGIAETEGVAWIGFADRALARRPPGPARVGATAGRLALGDKHLARVELELARMLGEVPADLATAIVVDGSRSMTDAQRTSQRELVAAYLGAARGSRAQVIAYARTAHALLPAWTSAAEAAARVERALAALAPRNGSNIDVGLAEAAAWLGRITGTRRVVLVTDEWLAARLERDPALLARRLPPGTLVHVVAVEADGELTRDDDDAVLAPLAAATGGMAVRAGVSADAALDATMLVRPISLDLITVTAPGWTQIAKTEEGTCGDRLVEGAACAWWAEGDPLAGPLTIEGFVWGRKVARVLAPDAARAHELARTFPDADALAEEHRAQLRVAARAVNAHWSLYAEWGGPDGYDDGFGMLRGTSCCSSGSTASHTIGFTSSRATPRPPPLDLAPQLAHVARTCDLRGARVEAAIETTLSEIVDVRVTAPPAVRACVEDAIWATALVVPAAYRQTTTRVAF